MSETVNDEQRVALVLGGSSGIGAGIAERLLRDGWCVWVGYHRNREAAERVIAAAPAQGAGYVCQADVRDEREIRHLFEQIDRHAGRLDVVVCSAVTEIAKTLTDASLDEWHTVLLTKLDQCFLATKYALPLLEKGRNAQVIYLTSHDGVRPDPDYIGYCVGTAGIIAFVKAMSRFLPRYGVRANAISPGAVKTPLWDNLGGDDPALWEELDRKNPMGRIATIHDVAGAAAWLVSAEAGMVNGNFLYVDGGAQWTG